MDDLTLSPSAMYDRAMLAADSIKGRYDARIASYDESLRKRLLLEQEIVTEMEAALADGQFEPWFQPQYNHSTGALIGAEALARWRHPEKGLVSPGIFIPIFEKNGFVYELDKSIWEQTCQYLKKWIDEGRNPLPASVNISRYDIFRPDLVDVITGLVKRYALPVELLRLEVTESAFSKSAEQIIAVVRRLLDAGFTVEIDDFGSGYSSLNTLKDVPAQVIKLDMKFLESTTNSQRGGNIVESIVRMAKWLDMSVIAEGVETMAQADFLRSIGCSYIQGYLYARPMPVQEYEALCKGAGKEEHLLTMETVENLDNNAFWDPESMDTLIFNSYVGGACIYEYQNGAIELLRATEKYAQMIGSAGMTVEDVLKLNWSEHISEETGRQIAAAVEESISSKNEVTKEFVFIDLPGCPRETHLRSTMRVIASAGDRYLVYCTNENITAQRKAEQSEREVAEQMRLIMANMNGGIAACSYSENGEMRILYANDQYYAMYGYTKKQFDAELSSVLDVIYPEDRERTIHVVNDMVKRRGSATYEYRCYKRDGSLITVWCNNAVTTFAGVSDTVLLSVTTDTTELFLAQQKERQAADQLQAIMKSVNGGISAMTVDDDLNATLVFANEKYYAMLGYTKEQYQAEVEHVSDVVYPADRSIAKDSVRQILSDHIPSESEYRCVKRDGSIMHVRASKSLARVEGYGDCVLISVITNITELVEAEQRATNLSEQMQAIMANINGGVTAAIIKEGKTRYLYKNRRYTEQLGYTKEQFDAEVPDPFALIHPDDRDRIAAQAIQASNAFLPYTCVYRVIRRDGTIRWIQSNATVITMSETGEEPVQLSVANDITEQVNAEQNERRISDRMQTIMDNVDIGIIAAVVKDGSAQYLFANDHYYAMLGYTKAQFQKEVHSPYQTVSEEDRSWVADETARINRTKASTVIEYNAITRDRRKLRLRSSISFCQLSEVSEPVQLSILRDITEETEAEQRERRSTEQMQAIMADVGCGITAAVLDEDGNIHLLFSNEKFFDIHGYTREQYEAEVTDKYTLIHPDDREKARRDTIQAYMTRTPTQLEYRLVWKDGSVRWVRVGLSSTHFTGVEENVHLCIFTDITAEKQSEQELRDTDEQLRFLNETAHALLAQPDTTAGIHDTLLKLMEYFCGIRAYIFEFDFDHHVLNNTYEVCAPGISEEKENLQSVPIAVIDYWLHSFEKHGYYAITDVSKLGDTRADERERLMSQGITSLFAVPLHRDGQLVGMIGVDDPHRPLTQVNRLVALGDYIAVMLTRRDLNARISSDNENLASMMRDMPGGFARFRIDADNAVKPIYFNESLIKLTGMSYVLLMDLYEKDALADIHPDDLSVAKRFLSQVKKSSDAISSRYRLRRGNGSYIWMKVSGRCTKDASGNMHLNVYYTDATEQIKEEKTQKELLDYFPYGAALYGFDGKQLSVVHINKRYWELVGLEPIDYSSTSILTAVYPEDRAVILREINAAIRQSRDAVCDFRIFSGDGVYKPFHVVARIILRDDGKYAIYASYTPISSEVMSYQQMLPVVLSTIMDSTTDLAFAKDMEFRYICASRAFADMAGLSDPKEVIGKTDYDLFEQETADKFRRDDKMLIESGKSIIDMVESIPAVDGIPHYSSTSKYLLRESGGNVIGLYGIGRDITEYRDAFSKLKLLTDNIPGGIATYEISKSRIRLIYRNDGFCKLFERTREKNDPGTVIDPSDWVFAEDLSKLQEQIDRLLLHNTPMDCVYRIRTRSGGYRWIDHKAVAADRRGGKVIAHAILQDVTDQHEIMDHLRQSEEENQLAIQLGGSIICQYGITDKSLTMSTEVAASFGLPEVTMNVPYEPVRLGLISEETAEAYTDFFEAILHGSKAGTVMFRQRYLGKWRWMEARSSTIFSESGEPVKAIITFLDVTERLEKEAAYKRWQQSLADRKPDSYTLFRCNLSKDVSLDTMEGSLLDIKFADDKKGFNERTRTYAQEHVYEEDRERYTSFANLEMLLANYYRGKRADSIEYREMLPDGGTRWLLLSVELVEYPNSSDVEAYLMYEDINDAKQTELQTKEMSENDPLTGVFNRATFVSKVKQTFQASGANAKHALIMLDVDGFKKINDVFGHGAGDQTLIEVAGILRSILRRGDLVGRIGGDEFVVFLSDIPNSVIAANKAKQICAMTRKSFSPEVKISCSVGVAIAPLDGEDFDTLYQKADLALYYVKGSSKDNYAFYRDSMENQHSEEEVFEPIPAAVSKPEKKRRMLIVDDSAIDHAMMANIFKDDFLIEKAKNGSAALIRLRHYGTAISVVLLDLMMPNIDGFAVLKQMQSYPELQGIPVIIVSGDDSRETCLRTIRSGATDFVTKPVDPDLLRIRVNSAVSKAENERLRAANSLLEQKSTNVNRFEAALECSGVSIIECDWLSSEFLYDPSIENYIAGTFDNRKLWHILLADMVTDTLTVKKMQEMVHRIADDRTLTHGSMLVQLKTPKGAQHQFRMNVRKLPNDFQLTTKLIITLIDMYLDPANPLS